jgi:hypothetical protein
VSALVYWALLVLLSCAAMKEAAWAVVPGRRHVLRRPDNAIPVDRSRN